jgi:hypothetical protein
MVAGDPALKKSLFPPASRTKAFGLAFSGQFDAL